MVSVFEDLLAYSISLDEGEERYEQLHEYPARVSVHLSALFLFTKFHYLTYFWIHV